MLRSNPIVGILGARQVGKTTLARQLVQESYPDATLFDLENPIDLDRLADPMLALSSRQGLIVIDEIQRRPDLFPVLRVLVDRSDSRASFLILGSASPELRHQSAESLAGRISYLDLDGLGLEEVGFEHLDTLWFRGGFPRSFTATDDAQSIEWRRQFIRTFLERDLPQLGIGVQAYTLRRFWTMLAHYHGQLWNGAEIARALGQSARNVRRYLDILASTYVVHILAPWWQNVGKRVVKSPKIYLSDTGLLHGLLGIETLDQLEGHPKIGASWEGLALRTIIEHIGARREECFFWATHSGAELDLLVVRGNTKRAFEIKRTSTPTTVRSMHTAIADLELEGLDIVHAGDQTWDITPSIRALSFMRLREDLEPL